MIEGSITAGQGCDNRVSPFNITLIPRLRLWSPKEHAKAQEGMQMFRAG